MEFWDEYGAPIRLFLVYAGGILAYTLITAALYGILSKRNMFGSKTKQKDAVGAMARGLAYLSLFPLISFAFFLLLAASLIFFNPEAPAANSFTIAMAIVAAVRATAYIHEDTAHELAKLMPLGLLGVFLVLNEFTTLGESFKALKVLVDDADVVGVFFAIVVLTEFLLRGIYLAVRGTKRGVVAHRKTSMTLAPPVHKPTMRLDPPK